ncbi:MAG TPA: Gfo/Idh/MocA family oxidoreductase [Chloroflexia bacterium]|nr:Gfo/Idh/MocA family oxidoreductase [Chloroflexia bacterium]
MPVIKWGIVGCGDVCEVKSGPGFQKAANSELVAVMRRNARMAEDFARRHNVPRWYSDAGTLINDPEVNAVYIATPPGSHLEYTRMAARAGKPVYVEKPMARNYEECQAMLEACREAGVPLFVAYYRRAMPRFLHIKQLLEEGVIGEVRLVTVQLYQAPPVAGAQLPWRVQPEISGGGLFVDVGSHALDLLDFYFGPVQQVAGFAANQGGYYPVEDLVTASFVHTSGVQVSGSWCFTTSQLSDRIEIVGSQGKISFALLAPDPILLTTTKGTQQIEFGYPPHVQQPLIQTVVDQLNGVGVCASTGESAARTSKVMDAVLKSYQQV